MPSSLPPEVQSLAEAGQQLLAAPAPAELTSGGIGGGLLSWLPWVVVVLAALFGSSYCGKDKGSATLAGGLRAGIGARRGGTRSAGSGTGRVRAEFHQA
ncbi:MAG: hypothetical protein U1E79_14925 [Ottowia sp.]